MFSFNHFIWIGLCAAMVVGLTVFAKKVQLPLRKAGYIMSAICICSELVKTANNMIPSDFGGMVLSPEALPFHLCSLLLFVTLYITFGKDGKVKQMLINFTAVAGTPGSICAILIPTDGTSFREIPPYQGFLYHAGLLWFSLYLILHRKAELGARSYLHNLLLIFVLMIVNLYINSILSAFGTNFMFLVRPPMENLPYLNLDHGWFVYFIHLLGLGMVLLTLFHLPFMLRKKADA